MPTLREIREANYISRRELADLAGVSESTIIRIEDPKHRTTQEVAKKVLEALSKKIGQVLTIDTVDGLNIYNVMRDRKQRTKGSQSDENDDTLDNAA
ncbi:MAG: helix-turn-helix transcriptional regulator [Ktedonobacteraceae bacterium]|nr:helix-turn-helix transcriptional regulator [Ktedonobacteraceae bacterium]